MNTWQQISLMLVLLVVLPTMTILYEVAAYLRAHNKLLAEDLRGMKAQHEKHFPQLRNEHSKADIGKEGLGSAK